MTLPLSTLSAFVLLCLAVSTSAERATCSITRYGNLTMFNGETEKVELLCKYRLADLTCDNYDIKVTPGSSVDGRRENRFSAETVWVSITKMSNGRKWIGRTATNLLKEAQANSAVWEDKEGDLPLDVAGFDPQRKAAVLERRGVFTITFSNGGDNDGVKVICVSPNRNLAPGVYPNSLCGDGSSRGTLTDRRHELYGYNSDDNSNHAVTILHDALDKADIIQSGRCQTITKDFQACGAQKKALAARLCGPIFTSRPLARCLIADKDDVSEFDICMTSVCGNDARACRSFKRDVLKKCPDHAEEFAELVC
ncbi:uncharacterized protein LOC143289656 [Babylonia areolata]|uniref:uncharacterized protein LOC143289656 n=1 Tax=Babylonia areolata TaxID=304850 RepID=UPI003FD60FE7